MRKKLPAIASKQWWCARILYPTKRKKVNRQRIVKKSNKRDIVLEMENGEISKLEIDGEVIPEEEYDDHLYLIENLQGDIPEPPAPPSPPAPPGALSPPAAPAPPAPPAPPAAPDAPKFKTKAKHKQKHKVKVITTEKDENGQTMIMIDGGDAEDLEILVDGDDDIIYIDGKMLEEGDSVIIVEIDEPYFDFNWKGLPNEF